MALRLVIAIAAASVAMTTATTAQKYPSQPLTWVVPYPAGGVTDNGARTVAKVLGEKLDQPVIIDNKPGAGGIVGTEYVVNGKKDGYTFLYSSNGTVSYPLLFKKMSFDPKKDLIPVHGMAYSPMLIIVRADSPFKTFADLIDHAKKNPERLNCASTGQGTTPHLLAERIQKEAASR